MKSSSDIGIQILTDKTITEFDDVCLKVIYKTKKLKYYSEYYQLNENNKKFKNYDFNFNYNSVSIKSDSVYRSDEDFYFECSSKNKKEPKSNDSLIAVKNWERHKRKYIS